MCTELSLLIARDQELRQRIRSIHKVLRGLEEMARMPALDCGPTTAEYPTAEQLTADGMTAVGPERRRSDQHPPTSQRTSQGTSQRTSSPPTASLRRACRIALMEAGGTASLEEICARIERRGSFSFVDLDHALGTLVQVLEDMALDGEVCCLKQGSCWRSERRTTQEPDSGSLLPPHPSMYVPHEDHRNEPLIAR